MRSLIRNARLVRNARLALTTAMLAVFISLATSSVAAASPDPDAGNRTFRDRGSEVLAIDVDHHVVVQIRNDGRPAQTVIDRLSDPRRLVADKLGNAYVIDAGTHQILKVGLRNGNRIIVRNNIAANTSMALDDRNNLYVLDGTAVLEYPSQAVRAVVLGHSTFSFSGTLTVDGAGHASVSSPPESNNLSDGVLIQTFPINGGEPTTRTLVGEPTGDGGTIAVGYFFGSVIEGRDGSLYFELESGGASGASYIVRVGPGSTTRLPLNKGISDYVYAVDRRGDFYLVQNRFWCNDPSRHNPTNPCVDDYAVDSVAKWRPAANHASSRAVNNLMLPVGGIAVDDRGDIYAAVTASRSATPANNDIPAQLVRITAGHSFPTVLARGHYAMPTVVNFCAH